MKHAVLTMSTQSGIWSCGGLGFGGGEAERCGGGGGGAARDVRTAASARSSSGGGGDVGRNGREREQGVSSEFARWCLFRPFGHEMLPSLERGRERGAGRLPPAHKQSLLAAPRGAILRSRSTAPSPPRTSLHERAKTRGERDKRGARPLSTAGSSVCDRALHCRPHIAPLLFDSFHQPFLLKHTTSSSSSSS